MNFQILSIDYGSERTGLAVTDSLFLIAKSLFAIKTINLMHFLNAYIFENNIQKVIIGESKNYSSFIEKEIQFFIKKFSIYFPRISIFRIDEFFTSKMATKDLIQIKKSNKTNKFLIDKISATLILQSYFIR